MFSGPAHARLGVAALAAALLLGATPAPTPSPSPDPCANADGTTGLLATLDRPTIGFSTCTVKPRETLLEFGYANETASDGATRTATYPQGFLRYGLRPGLELDVIGPAATASRVGDSVQRGWNDSGVGIKRQFASVGNAQFAVDALLTLPTGSPAFTSGGPVETLNLDAGYALTPATGFATTIGVASQTGTSLDGSTGRFTAVLPSAVVTQQLGQRTQLYLEAYGATRIRPDGGTRFAVDGGVQYLLATRIELDTEFGSTVTDIQRTHYYGLGLGLRL